jgi:hypothetical protein
MNTIAQTLAALEPGQAAVHDNLAVFPLFGATDDGGAGYLTLDEALESGAARITEVSESGHVPELRFVNDSDRRILLVDGEELVGARQNRVLNLTILVGEHRQVVIPVSCVERGRWSYRTREFGSARRSLYAKSRAAKMRDVSMSMRASGERTGDQQRVWAGIARKQRAMRVASETEAMADLYVRHQGDLDAYATAFEAQPRQVGAVFAINGSIRGAELFDSAATFGKFLRKVVGSYALDAVEERGQGTAAPPDLSEVRAFLARLQAAPQTSFDALAEGTDVRVEDAAAAAAALVVDAKVVHLAAFAAGLDG